MAQNNEILQELRNIAPELARIGPVTPYKVPAGYFDDLADLILMRIKSMNAQTAGEEISMLSPLLGGLKKEMPYKVPDGYFENLVAARKTEAPVRSISFSRRVWQYASAAVVAGIIAVTVWFAVDRSPVKNSPVLAQSDSISAKELTNISDVEIENFLDGNIGVINFEPSSSPGEIKAEDIRLMLAEVSDKELENYLN